MVKILLVTSSYLPRIGGLQTVTSNLAAELQKQGHSVKVVTQQYPRSLPARERIEGVKVRRLRFLWPTFGSLHDGRLDLWLEGLIYLPVTLAALLKLLLREKPQIVNLHFLGAPTLFLLVAKKLLKFTYIISLHGDDVQGFSRASRFDKWIFRASLRSADAVTACSRSLLDEAQSIEPAITGKAQLIYNGIDIKAPFTHSVDNPTNQSHKIVAVGRMVPKKGFDLLLKALPSVRDHHPCTQFLLIGDGPERLDLEELASTLQLNDCVSFVGEQTHDEAMRLMAGASLVAIPSREEPFGLVALEAMSLGKPVVATTAGGLPEVLEGAEALLVPPGDAEALASAIIELTEKKKFDPAFGERNRHIAERFSTAKMTDHYLTLYRSLSTPAAPEKQPVSSVGDRWRTYLDRNELSWCNPELTGPTNFQQHARSEWITSILRYTGVKQESGPVLEAGCGTAMFGLSLATLGYKVDAFDYNDEALAFARKLKPKAQEANPTLKADFFRADLLNIPVPDNTYTLVFNQAVIEYFTSDMERARALSEMVRVAKPGGWVAIISQNLGHPLQGFWRKTGYKGYTDGPPMHTYSARKMARELASAGLSNIQTDGINPWSFLFLWPRWYMKWRVTHNTVYLSGKLLSRIPLPTNLRATLAPQIIAVGQKPDVNR